VLSLLNTKSKKREELWEALVGHGHIEHLEIHNPTFFVRRLFGPVSNGLTMSALVLSGRGKRIDLYLVDFIRHLQMLERMELRRFILRPMDWSRIMFNKSRLRQLRIGSACLFDEGTRGPGPAEGGLEATRERRFLDCQIVLRVVELELSDNMMSLAIQKAILAASPDVRRLDICHTKRADGVKVAALVQEYCAGISSLVLRSSRQPWAIAILQTMPVSVVDLALYTGQLDGEMAAVISSRKATLTRLQMDF
ncbi:hypothetical protein BGZ97_010488, partial [Linnemannia gamsii]